ncbi:MAG: phosphomannomutase/phosphoglucomutase [Luminiphilus sp.]|nr:phosphomannomutase/phosphoglucomutase [Luminiphilus sp.]
MSAEQKNQKDGEVTSEGNALRGLIVRAGVVALVPALLAFTWLGLIREPISQATNAAKLAQVSVDGRAAMLSLYVADLDQRVDLAALQLVDQTLARNVDPSTIGFPDADAVTFIPLDDLGTVNISPGDHGLRTHIDIDVVRRAFGGENPLPESILTDDKAYTLFARGLGTPVSGVIVIEVSNKRLEELVVAGAEGQYRIVQELPGMSGVTVAGQLSIEPKASTPIRNTPWRLEFAPSAQWLSQAQPGWWDLGLSIALVLVGILAALYLLAARSEKILSREVQQIIEAAELRSALSIAIPSLTPLAKMLRQLSLLSRRQLVSQARRDATRDDSPESEPEAPQNKPKVPEPRSNADSVREQTDGKPTITSGDSFPDHIFRPASIRGDVRTELSDELVERIAQAIAVMCGERGVQALVVAHDARQSSRKIRTTLVKALLASGRDVIDAGEIPTPTFYFATHESDADSGIMITGGHGNEHMNGLKIVLKRKILSGVDIDEILANVRARKTTQGSGRTVRLRVESDYVDRIAMDVSLALPLKVVVDNDFGTAARIAPQLLEALDCDLINLNTPEDGPREEGLSLEAALEALGKKVAAEGADLGVLFDADGDRLHTVTETGASVSNDKLLMLFARDMLERNPGADVVYDITCTRQFAPFITRAGGRAQMSRSGQAFIHEKMRQANALLAGDFAGHMFFKERWYGFDDAIYATARLLEILAAASSSFGEMIAALPSSIATPEITVPLDDKVRKKVMRSLVSNADFPGARITTLDGLRVDYADGWGLVHNSTTESAIMLRFEGNDQASIERVKGVLRKALQDADSSMDLPF